MVSGHTPRCRYLNQLASLGNAQDVRVGIDREVGRQVDQLLERIVKDYDRNPEVFEDVLEELGPLVDRQARAYRGNVERTVRASEGQQKLARARRAVAISLEPSSRAKDVPELFLQLMNPGWRNLLVHTHCGTAQTATSGAMRRQPPKKF